MNYQHIHDVLIRRAQERSPIEGIYYEKHHIIPVCEGGAEDGETVLLTFKEHRIIHLLRWKITNNMGNKVAYNLMTNIDSEIRRKENAKYAANLSHILFKERDPIAYTERQRLAGKSGGQKAVDLKLGFHGLSEEVLTEARNRGRMTLITNKLGMFSDEFREQQKLIQHKKVHTPDGIFNSMMEAAEHYGIVCGTLTYRVNNSRDRWSQWYYINKENVNEE